MPIAGMIPSGVQQGAQQMAQAQQVNAPPANPAQQRVIVEPAQVEANQNAWTRILDQMNDPVIQKTLLSFGGRLLQGVQPGQTSQSTIGSALLGAADDNVKLRQQQEENMRKDLLAKQAERRTVVAEKSQVEQKRKTGVAEARTEKREGPTGIQTRLEESEIKRNERKPVGATAKPGAQQQMTSALAQRLVATGEFENEDQAFLKAFEIVKSTAGKTREQKILDTATEIFATSLDRTPEAMKESVNFATELIDSIEPQTQGSAAPAPASPQNAATPTPQQIEALRANPDRAAEFDALFGEGAAETLLGAQQAAPPRATTRRGRREQ